MNRQTPTCRINSPSQSSDAAVQVITVSPAAVRAQPRAVPLIHSQEDPTTMDNHMGRKGRWERPVDASRRALNANFNFKLDFLSFVKSEQRGNSFVKLKLAAIAPSYTLMLKQLAYYLPCSIPLKVCSETDRPVAGRQIKPRKQPCHPPSLELEEELTRCKAGVYRAQGKVADASNHSVSPLLC